MGNLRISVLVSGDGSNLQAIIDAIKDGKLENVEIVQVISSNAQAYALKRAQLAGIPTVVVSRHDFKDYCDRMEIVKQHLDTKMTDLVVLAGYLSILPPSIVSTYVGKIINVHPALLPLHGGKECYGIKVHQEVIDSGEKESGATVHFVDEGIDTGKIILQGKVPVLPGDTATSLRDRVLEVEHQILPEAINLIMEARY